MKTEELNRSENQRERSERNKPPKLEWLVENGEWTRLNESTEFMEMTREGRILIAQEAVGNRKQSLAKSFYQVVRTSTEKGKVVLGKMRFLNHVSDLLNDVLIGNIQDEKMPREIRDLVKSRKPA